MKHSVVCGGVFAMVLGLAAPALATNGYQLIGVGQIQKSMAGAVTAAPMDTMTAISNPAGMARVAGRADFSMEAFMPHRSVQFGPNKEKGGSELYGIPSVGWVANAFNRDNMYFGGGMFATSGMGVDYGQVLLAPAGAFGGGAPPADVYFSGYSAVQFWKMAPTVAWNQSDRLSFGASLNVDYQSLTFVQSFHDVNGNPFFKMDLGRPTNQMGFGATLGMLYDVSDAITLGATYASKQSFGDATYRLATGDIDTTILGGGAAQAGKYKMDIDYPQQAALGISARPSDALLVDLDVKWINWSATHDTVTLSGPGATIPLTFGWDNQVVYAMGVQWAATDSLKLRGGFNYGKSPIGKEDVMSNLIFPAIVEKHLTLGFEYRLGDHWGIGGTYMKAFKETMTGANDVSSGFQAAGFPASSGSKIALEEDSVGLLLNYLF